eukprot:GHVS01000033.1.p1 GENE.GHVS01000033.1~~GHVS01000033.1.p1  ORF type:complete len:127 (+),score=3.92 GHVS01000033.1:91-471(+)
MLDATGGRAMNLSAVQCNGSQLGLNSWIALVASNCSCGSESLLGMIKGGAFGKLTVSILSLSNNGITDESLDTLEELLQELSYRRRVDLKRNFLSSAGIRQLETMLAHMPGVTNIKPTVADKIVAA